MKHTLLIALLGATITLATPTLSYADNSYKFKNGDLDQNYSKNQKQRNKHNRQKSQANKNRSQQRNDHKRFVAKPPKPHRVIKQIKRDLNKIRHQDKRVSKNDRGYNKQRNNNHNYRNNRSNHNNKPSFSISWNVGDSTISYGNDRNYSTYNKSYNKGHRRNHGKRIYGRIHNQSNRIQRGINNGQLVKREVRKLRREQRDIKQTLNHFKRDGRFNRHEASKLNQLLDIASNNIHRKSNNHLTRYTRNHDQYVQY